MYHNLPDQLVQSDSIQLGDIGVLPDLNNGETISSPVEHVMDEEYYRNYWSCSMAARKTDTDYLPLQLLAAMCQQNAYDAKRKGL